MKRLLIILSILSILSCDSEDDSVSMGNPENVSILVEPIQTDPGYSSTNKDHYVVRNNQVHLNKLLLFLGGSFSTPNDYATIADHSATIGLDVISLSYTNTVPTAPLGSIPNPLIFDHYREEICFGNQVSDEVEVNTLNSVQTRTIKLLEYLNNAYPNQNWNQYLTSSNELRWDRIIVSGHSQGSGHACYLGKKNTVDRVVMFSGPNDYSSFYNEPANWLTERGATPLANHFSLLHIQDEIVSFDNQVSNLRGLGLLSATEEPILVDDLVAPYTNANSLSLNISAFSNHSSTIGANAVLPEIWTYMFTNN